jgi:hypothetical protein
MLTWNEACVEGDQCLTCNGICGTGKLLIGHHNTNIHIHMHIYSMCLYIGLYIHAHTHLKTVFIDRLLHRCQSILPLSQVNRGRIEAEYRIK